MGKFLYFLLLKVLKNFVLLASLLVCVNISAQKIEKLEQAANGSLSSIDNPVDWVTGNVNAAKAHYIECMTIPYHLEVVNLVPGSSYSVSIGWDTKKGVNEHAIDYLTSYDHNGNHSAFGHSPEVIDPLDNTALDNTSPTENRYAIPSPNATDSGTPNQPTNAFNSLAPSEREMSIFNGTISSMSYTAQDDLDLAAASSYLKIDFVASASTVVLAWGGHIAAKEIWGVGNSATAISGSPYHMFVDDCVGLDGCGNKEVQLQASAVQSPPTCDITGPDSTCAVEGSNLIFEAQTDLGTTFGWELINNTSGASIVGINNDQSVTVDPGNNDGSFQVQVTIGLPVTGGTVETICSKIVEVYEAPKAGENGTIALCEGDAAPTEAELFAALGATADEGGTWSGPDAAGVYTYTHAATQTCPEDSATVTVSYEEPKEAGENGTIALCEGDAAPTEAELFAALGATADEGGTWSGPDAAGVYTYTHAATQTCPEDSATVTVSYEEPKEAGENGTIALCEGDAAPTEAELFAALGATADEGGTWSGPDAAGVYTYTHAATQTCPEDSATVTINIEDAPEPNITGNNVYCYDGNGVTLDAGAGYTSYLWSTGETTQMITVDAGSYTVQVSNDQGCEATSEAFTVRSYEMLSCSIVQDELATNFQAADGVATVTPMGGSGDYTYLWDNGETTQTATQLTYGMHSVTVTDAECGETTCEIFISKNLICGVSLVSAATCAGGNDGVATVTAFGGYGDYSYSWDGGPFVASPTNSALSAGNHTVIVMDETGATTQCYIDVPGGGAVDLSCGIVQNQLATNFQTADGVATVTPVGGSGSYSFLWDNGETTQTANQLTYGMHTVNVVDLNGCGETSCEIFIQKNIICSVRLDSPVSYAGGSDGQATVTVFGGYPGYTYSWDGAAFSDNSTVSNLNVGYHTVTVMDTVGNTTECSVMVTGPNDLTCSISQIELASNYLSNDGSATVYAEGGSGAYTYLWDNGETTQTAIALTYGVHSVLIKDSNGHETECEIYINKVLICGITLDSPAGCTTGGGVASVKAYGGYAPYTYSWDGGAYTSNDTNDNLSVGTHSVTVMDSTGATSQCWIEVIGTGEMSCSITQDALASNYLSADGVATVNPIGGSGSYTYLWDNGETTQTATMLTYGPHTVTVTDSNGCGWTSCEIMINKNLICSAGQVSPATCAGSEDGVASVNAYGGYAPYTYSWDGSGFSSDNTADNLGVGYHTVVVMDATGATSECSVMISGPNVLGCSINVTNDISAFGAHDGSATAIAVGGTAPYDYEWSNGETTASVEGLGAGTYTATITDANGCTVSLEVTIAEGDTEGVVVTEEETVEEVFIVDTEVSVDEPEEEQESEEVFIVEDNTTNTDSSTLGDPNPGITVSETVVKAYPLTFVNDLNLNIKINYDAKLNIRMYDMNGRTVLSDDSRFVKKGSNELRFNVNRLAPDVYVLIIHTGSERIVKKVMSRK
ncbi:T9SS type A sorting domain-containing protein [Maribacter algicola]|uniref:T9SS type A sorting domain-containing protein n=1 Tax=Meishania litoralis TaxID=3434685 RepID=A0ACC7LMQ4_9FLAO